MLSPYIGNIIMSKIKDPITAAFNIESTMTPREIVSALDNHIVGQAEAKRAVANALRTRWRRMHVEEKLRKEITPKNILMIGPTGVGKTEIARRLAALAKAPFIKVEATKFTEVGYVGRDVDSIIRDLIEISIKMIREDAMTKVKTRAEESAEERVLNALLPPVRDETSNLQPLVEGESTKINDTETRQIFRKKLREGKLDDKEIEIDVASSIGVEIMTPPGMEEIANQLQGFMQSMSSDRVRRRKMRVKEALKHITEEEASKMVNEDEIRSLALEAAEQNGIVFIDEFDKIVRRTEHTGADVSREGVQRDLLPIIEGSTVSTKYGIIKTDHILFIASGAFQLAKPSDLIPELQGRLPIRVELKPLTADDFIRILTEPSASLTEQYTALMQTEGVSLVFNDDGIRSIAEIAFQANERMENIGARRLYTVMERLLEQVSFEATDRSGETIVINKDYVKTQLAQLVEDEDLSHYIL